MTSRQLEQGSRLVMVLRVSKRPDREINYGTGGDVSEESIADGKDAPQDPLVQRQLHRGAGPADATLTARRRGRCTSRVGAVLDGQRPGLAAVPALLV